MCAGGKELHIVQIIIDLGHHLALSVIAEGVETREQLQRLQDMGCDLVQGYVYARPVSAQAAGDMVRQQARAGVGFFQECVAAG
jgi:EAL domain-containing protein (putative c-di-GMP-specific phosphodiesterase class I)